MKTLRCHKKRLSSRGIGPEGTTPSINSPLSPKRFIHFYDGTNLHLSYYQYNLSPFSLPFFLSFFLFSSSRKFDRPRDIRDIPNETTDRRETEGETRPINSVGECSLRSRFHPRNSHSRELPLRVWQASVKQLVGSEEDRSEEAVFPRRWMKKEARAESGMDKWTTFVQMVEPLHNLSRDQQRYLPPSFFFRYSRRINLFFTYFNLLSLTNYLFNND